MIITVVQGFCTGPGSTVKLSINPDNAPQLYTRQYKIAEKYMEEADVIVKKWIADGRVIRAPDGCRLILLVSSS